MSEESEMWQTWRERKKETKLWHQQNTTPKEKEFLSTLSAVRSVKIENDGAGGEKYVIEVFTAQGYKTVEWWTATGKWAVRKGKGKGKGLYSMARYFHLIERVEK